MTAPADRELNVEKLATTLYEIQVSVAMLIEQLARARNPAVNSLAITDLVLLNEVLQRHHPSLQRH